MSAPLLVGPGLVGRRLRVPRHQVALLRYLVEAHDGLANLHGDGDGAITLVTPTSQAAALDALLVDLCAELELPPPEPV